MQVSRLLRAPNCFLRRNCMKRRGHHVSPPTASFPRRDVGSVACNGLFLASWMLDMKPHQKP